MQEKDALLAKSISEHFTTQKSNPVYIPVEHLLAKGLDISDIRNSFWRLKDNGTIKDHRHCWGFFELQKNKKTFKITSSEQAVTDDDTEVYEVEVIPSRLTQENSGGLTIHLTAQGDLYREPKEKFCYEMSGKGVPIRILKHFADNPNNDYQENTVAAANAIGIGAEQLRKEINKMRKPIRDALNLEEDLLEGRKNSGYRINPNIKLLLGN